MRIVEDLAPGDKNHEHPQGIGVTQRGQPNGEKKDKKRRPKKRRYHRFTLPCHTLHHMFFFWKATRTTKEIERRKERAEKTANAPPNREGESAIVPSFCGGSMSLSLSLSLCGGSSSLSLSFVYVVVSHSTLSFLMVPVSPFSISTEGTNHHHYKRTREKEHH